MTFALAETTGWVVAGLTLATVALPYVLRRRPTPGSYLARLQPHYWIGFTIAGLSVLHTGLALSSDAAPGGADWTVGIWVAFGALLLVFGQVSLGLGLRAGPGASPAERRRRRRLHLATMVLLVAGGLVHVALNGPLVRSLLA